MHLALLILGWVFGVLLVVVGALLMFTGNPLMGIPLVLIAVLILPPLRAVEEHLLREPLVWWVRGIAVVVLLAAFYAVIFIGMIGQTSIYASPEVEARLMTLYDEAMASWPVPYENRYVETEYGSMHVVVCGPEDAPPLLLVHASGVAAFSWRPNVAALSRSRRIYAVDLFGEANRTRIDEIGHLPETGPQAATLLATVLDTLGVERADVVGASIGGFVSLNLAIHHPERVARLALLCPMGLAPTGRTVAIMTLATMFPVGPLQDWAAKWALGDSPETEELSGEWFRVMMGGVVPKPTMPRVLSSEELASIKTPTLLILGRNDGVVDADAASAQAGSIPDLEVIVLDGGHLIGVDHAEDCNEMLSEFLDRNPVSGSL
jgi:pimeloyl-ACP methyl ester carboxylesterase